MNIAICDDEIDFLKIINKYIREVLQEMDVESNINLFHKGRLLNNCSNLESFDIIFLDIELTDINGIKLAKKLRRKKYEGLIVFITSHLDYSILGYEVEAFRYILKMNLDTGIKECLQAAIKKIGLPEKSFVLKANNEKIHIYLKNITYIESNDHRIIYHMKDKTEHTIYDKLNEIEKNISSNDFYRIHQSYLVNSNYLEKIKRYEAHLKGEIKLPISKARYSDIEDKLLLKENKWI